MLATAREDVQAVLQRDPAAFHWLQVVLFYPGLHALWAHRIAYKLWHARLRLLAFGIAQMARWLTGVEIHPAAKIGARFFIDHGMGVVIGETAEIGADVTLYHGVTLGGVSLEHVKRHPTLEDGVTVGAGAKLLGAITVGQNARIGANAVVIKDVAPGQVVVGFPNRSRSLPGDEPPVLPDQIDGLMDRLNQLEQSLMILKTEQRETIEIDYTI